MILHLNTLGMIIKKITLCFIYLFLKLDDIVLVATSSFLGVIWTYLDIHMDKFFN